LVNPNLTLFLLKKIVGALMFGAGRRAISLQFLQEVQVRGVVLLMCATILEHCFSQLNPA